MEQASSQQQNIKTKIAIGFSALLFREFLFKVIAFGAQIILARLISPKDFGFYAIIAFIITFFGIFSDIGLSSAIIQKKEKISDNELTSIFYFKCLVNVFLIVSIFFISPIFLHIYTSLSSLEILMTRILSLTLLIDALQS